MPLPSYDNVASRFGNNQESIAQYFLLVDLYKDRIDPRNLDKFINSGDIDEMINLVGDEKDLKYLLKLLRELISKKIKIRGSDKPVRVCLRGETASGLVDDFARPTCNMFSQWFQDEFIVNNLKNMPLKSAFSVSEAGNVLIKKIKSMPIMIAKKDDRMQSVFKNYTNMLRNFNNDSIAYRQYLVIQDRFKWLTPQQRIYDIPTILKRLSLPDLYLVRAILSNHPGIIGNHLADLEPYLYRKLTCEDKSIRDEEEKIFKKCIKLLLVKIEAEIATKENFFGDKIDNLEIGAKTYEDILEILLSITRADAPDAYVKSCIDDITRLGAHSGEIGRFMRRAYIGKVYNYLNLPVVSKQITSKALYQRLLNQVNNIRLSLGKLILSHSYVVYRGVGYDAIVAMFKVAGYSLPEKLEDLTEDTIKIINKNHPIIYDKSFISTSFNKNVSYSRFGKCLFTIHIPGGSQAIILDRENIASDPTEEEMFLREATRLRVSFFEKTSDDSVEIDCDVVKIS